MLCSARATKVIALFFPAPRTFASRQILSIPSTPSSTMSLGKGAFLSTISPVLAVTEPYACRYSGKLMLNQRCRRFFARVMLSTIPQRLLKPSLRSAYTPDGRYGRKYLPSVTSLAITLGSFRSSFLCVLSSSSLLCFTCCGATRTTRTPFSVRN